MKKRLLALILSLVMVLSIALPSQAAENTWDETDFSFVENEDGTVAITGLTASGLEALAADANMVMPSTIDGKTVTAIADAAAGGGTGCFATDANKLGAVTLPANLMTIGKWAFQNAGVTSVTFPNTLTSIGMAAFQGCLMEEVILPDSVGNNVLGGAFGSMPNLKKVKLPTTMTEIPASIFVNNSGNANFTSIEIPEGVTSIGSSAFAGNNFSEIVLPSTVKTIGSGAFSQSGTVHSLKKVVLNEGLEKIDSNAFRNCKDLTSVEIPSTVTSINKNAFRDCNDIVKLYVKNEEQLASLSATASKYHEVILLLERPQAWAEALGLKEVSGAEAIKAIGTENSIFVDLRAKEDYAAGYIKNSISAPVCDLDYSVPSTNREAFIEKMNELQVAEKNTTIYLSCYAGTFCVDYAADWLINHCGVKAEQLVRVTGGTMGDADLKAASNQVSFEYALDQVKEGEGFILDVRATDTYYANGYLDGALHAPLFDANGVSNGEDTLAANFTAFVKTNKALFESKKVYILCNSGARGAEAATKLLTAAGIKGARTIEGGAKYVTANYPELFVNQQYVSGADTVAAANAADDKKVVIDLRTVENFDKGHIKGVPSYPVFGASGVTNGYDELAMNFLDKVKANAEFFAGNDIYLICNSGARGAQAATKLLMQAGYSNSNIYTVTGGFKGTEEDKSIPENSRFVSGAQAVRVIDDKTNYLIIDVRATDVFAKGHLKNSVNLPLFGAGNAATTLEDDMAANFLAYINDNKEALSAKTIYILCNSGARGVTNAFTLAKQAGLEDAKVFGIEGGAKDADVKAELRFVTADYVLGVLKNEETVIVDVRSAVKYAAGHIEGSISLPLFAEDNTATTLEDDMAKYFCAYIKDNADYFEDKNVYILCNSGQRGVVNAFALARQAGLAAEKVLGISGGATNASLQALFTTDTVNIASVKQSSKKFTYTGKSLLPKITVKDSEGKTLVKGTDYVFVIYNANGKKVTSTKAVGKYTVKITYRGAYIGNAQSVISYTIVPKAVTNLKASLVPNKGYNDVKLTWTKSTGATGYYVYYKKSTAASYSTKYRKAVTGNSVTIKNLSGGVKYNFKVVAYYGNDKVTSGKYTTVSKTTLKKVTGVKVSRSGKKVKVSWTNINGETGYQISCSTKKTGTANIVTCTGANLKNKNITLKKADKRYYKVRAYKVENGKRVYGPWSAVVYK